MLVISRRIGESFVIGDDIIATVVDISGEKVVLGVEAPKAIPIERLDDKQPGGRRVNKHGYGRQQNKNQNTPPKSN